MSRPGRFPRAVKSYGHDALLVEWEQRIDSEINASVHRYAAALRSHPAIRECIPAYASLLVTFRAEQISAYALREYIYDLRPATTVTARNRLHRLPVCYGGNYGPDLVLTAKITGLSPTQLIKIHAGREYQVYFLGYQPGFGFLGQTEAKITVPRLSSPRSAVPAGAVGLAGRQTGVYPLAAPGGWRLIGNCPLPMVNAEKTKFRLAAGDRVSFYPVTEAEYLELRNHPPPWPEN